MLPNIFLQGTPHQLFPVLMAGQPLHHQPSLVLMAGRPLQHQPVQDDAYPSKIWLLQLYQGGHICPRCSFINSTGTRTTHIRPRFSFFSSARMTHACPSGVSRPPGPWTATGRRTGFQTLTPQPGTIFPGTPARFFARPGWSYWRQSLGGGPVAAYLLTRIMARIYMYSNLRRRGEEILQMVLE